MEVLLGRYAEFFPREASRRLLWVVVAIRIAAVSALAP